MDRSGERWFASGTHRVKGDLHLANGPKIVDAEACYTRAISITREQGARGLELRMANSLEQLWADQGAVGEARDLLQPIYDTFTDGFEFADPTEARELVAALSKSFHKGIT